MDPLKNLIIGRIVRGILWAGGGLAAKFGIEVISESTAEAIAAFLVAAALAIAASYWSKRKDKKLADS